ncbi:MAG TPA: peptidoglycan-binding protein [Pedobacter sp.]
MSKIKVFTCCLCLAIACRSWVLGGDMLNTSHGPGSEVLSSVKRDALGHIIPRPERLIPIALAELWVREERNKNEGKRVEEYLAVVGLRKGEPYCAAFVSWVFQQAGYPSPRTGWSPALFPHPRLVKAAAPGNVFGIYFPAMKRIAHCGLVVSSRSDWITTVEGNTDASGGREGGGVYQRLRHKKSIRVFADWRVKIQR